MKQIQECPLCKGHGLLRIEMQQRWWWQKLSIMRWLCAKWRNLTAAEDP